MNSLNFDEATLFLDTYSKCREAFRETALQAGAVLSSYEHPDQRDASGAALAIDVALVGVPAAERLLVMFSGTHGNEGFIGHAIQVDLLRRMDLEQLRADNVAVLLVHAVNPYGWAHGSRTNEHQVDLNRNFVDFAEARCEHPLAAEIQRATIASTPTGPDFPAINAALQEIIDQHGLAAVSDAVQQGQYFKSDGIGFGGFAPEWSTQQLRDVFGRFFSGHRTICLIDWHTGLGAYGEPMFLCFDPVGSEAWVTAASWWGEDTLGTADQSYQSGTRPKYSGLLMNAAQSAARAAGATAIGAVIEIGTFEPREAANCLMIDRWLRNQPVDADPDRVEMLQRQARDFFYPNEPIWNGSALAAGRKIVDEAYRGLVVTS